MTKNKFLLSVSLAAPFALAAALPACLPEAPKFSPAPVETVADMGQQTIDAETRLSARAYFTQKVLPLLTPTCAGCHKTDGGVGPAFLKSGSTEVYDPYPIVFAWNNFVVDNPDLSQLLKKGQHEGPALNMDQSDAVLTWLLLEKAEKDAANLTPFKPQTKPFYPVLTANTETKIDLGALDASFTGAYVSFVATEIKQNGLTRGLEISKLKLVNIKAGAKMGDQRTVRFKRPLFILWQSGQPTPDPIDSFASTDQTVSLDTTGATTGSTIIPGLLTLSGYRPGSALSLSFDILQLVAPSAGSNPCTTNGLNTFVSQVRPYIGKAQSCTNGTLCHNATGNAGGVNMDSALLATTDPKYTTATATLCEVLKFYNGVNVLSDNTDPQAGRGHPFKWSATSCASNGYPGTCFTDFKTALQNWRTAEQ